MVDDATERNQSPKVTYLVFKCPHVYSTTLYRICYLLNNVKFLMRNDISKYSVVFQDLLYIIANSSHSSLRDIYPHNTFPQTIFYLRKNVWKPLLYLLQDCKM